MNNIKRTAELIDLSHTLAGAVLARFEYPWQAIPHIKEEIIALGRSLSSEEYESPEENVWISKGARVAKSAHIGAPCIIEDGAEIRHCAFIRGAALIGKGAVIGNSTEVKNAIISDGVQLPHYNYVGDSILGYCAHLGAGAVISNVKSDKMPVSVHCDGETIATGLKKFGAVVGNFCEIGCGAVLNPGTVLGERTSVYPLVSVRGFIGEGCIVKAQNSIVKRL